MLRQGRPARRVRGGFAGRELKANIEEIINPLSRKKSIISRWFTDNEANTCVLMFDRKVRRGSLLLSHPTSPPNWIYIPVNWCRNKFAALQELKVKLPERRFYTAAQWSGAGQVNRGMQAPLHPPPHFWPGCAVALWFPNWRVKPPQGQRVQTENSTTFNRSPQP